MTPELNPLEALTEELSDDYVDLVYELVDEFAPVRPWWTVSLSADQQLWRWAIGQSGTEQDGVRATVLPWIMQAAASVGAKSADEALSMIAWIVTSKSAEDLIPLDIQARIPEELLEIVQASGPKDAQAHIQKMERLFAQRLEATAILQNSDQPNVPEPPNSPPPEPVELVAGTAGWPNYGMVPKESPPAFSIPG